ncbi:putative Ig domain-containing protein [Pseudomonas sp. KU43P]|uniref:putative Ig domain-containing protein n=1 Tax=Pseudomonas sp. KU43P TaxID=2487887 RepID=UPI0012A99F36|nr:putative Ig domain-containing protein [Pseudomonas sp. KU43P]BBH45774.1 hypothetical protein KU43P_22510 [Pseudomonas sp. KU43P]
MTRSRVLPRSPLYTLLCCLWLLALALILPAQASAMTVSPPAGSNLGSFPAGQNLSIPLSVSGGNLPMTGWYDCDAFNLNNCLPSGLVIEESLNSTSTTIHGVPNVQAGTYNFMITVFDNSSWEIVPYSITITGAGPTLTSLSPSSGSTAGGNTVTITGTGFTGASAVRFGAKAALAFTVNSSTQITATAPSGSAGVVDVVVTTAGGVSPTSTASQYSYTAPPTAGPVSATVAANSSNNPITLNLSGAATSVAVASQASHGTATASGTSISYTPTAGYSGSDSFTYTATNASGTSAAATVTVTVSPPSLAITPGSLVNATAGTAYNQTLSSANGSAPYTYALISGALPAGMTFSSAGVFSGTPSSSGTFNLTVRSTDQYGATGTVNYTLSVAAPVIDVMPLTLPAGTYGAPYSQTISATGGIGSYSFSVIAGSLPSGLSLSSGGTLSGTPANAGSYSFSLRATDGNGFSGTRAYTMPIASPTLSLSPISLANGIAGTAYSQAFSSSGGIGPYSYSITSGSLPSGMSLTSAGVLSGTATSAGTFNFSLSSTDANGMSITQSYSLVVGAPSIILAPTTLAPMQVGSASSQTLSASGGSAPYAYAITSGALPAGITLSSTGALSGTPTTSGAYTLTITATDSMGFAGSRSYSGTVGQGTPVAGNVSLTVAANSSANPVTLNLSGGTATSVAVASNASNGVASASGTSITYTPNPGFAGSDSFTYTATGPGGTSNTATVSVTVTAPTIVLTPASIPGASVATAYSVTLGASGGSAPYTYSVTSGALPTGITLSAGGVLSGTPTAAGSFNFAVTATDNTGFTGTQAYSFSVGQAAPVAGNITFIVSANSIAIPVGLILSGGPTASVAVANNASHGVASASGTSITYTPNPGFAGSDSFTYTATGPGGTSNTATVSVTVTAPTIVLTPTSIPGATVASAYSATLAASGGSAPYTYSLATGALPAGITLSAAGVLSGTPTAAGNFNFTLSATDNTGFSGAQAYSLSVGEAAPVAGNLSVSVAANSSANPVTLTLSGGPAASVAVASNASNGVASASGTSITYTPNPGFAGSDSFTYNATGPGGTSNTATVSVTVTAPTIVLTPTSIPGATVASAYSATLVASGGIAPYTYSLSAGTLPAGITLSAAGVLSGTPTAAGSFNFTVTATDNTGFSGTQAYSFSVGQPAPVAGNLTLTVAANSSANPVTLSLSGGPAASVAVASNASNGVASASGTSITYTPNPGFAGSDSFTYTATGPGGTSNTATVSVTVTAPTIVLTPSSIPGATVASAYSATLAASGGNAPYTYSLATGTLPAGITLSAAGVLSGTPTAAGSFNFTVTATDNTGFSGAQAFSLAIANQAPVAGAVSASIAANSAATLIALDLDGGAASSIAVSTAPSHGTASVSGLTLSYTPRAGYSGSDSFAYTVSGPGGTSAPATVTITVSAPTLAITPTTPNLPPATQGLAYSASLGASGGTPPYRYSVAGTLPAGLTLDSASGSVSGTPTAVGDNRFTISVTDANGATGSQVYNLTTAAQAVVVPPSSETLTPGQAATIDLTRGASGGPFLRARLLSVSPAGAGSASLSGPFTLNFTPAAAFAGTAVVAFSLENIGGNSASSTVTFTVQARPDPTRDAEVIGLLNAQSRAAERFASTQMDNFNRRLEQLHRPTCDRDSFNANVRHGRDDVSLGSLGKALRDELDGNGKGQEDERRRQEKDSAQATSGECREEALAFWTDGFVNTGSNRARGAKDNSFTTFGLSAGMDYRLSPRAVVGVGIGYGNDRTDVGEQDSRSEGDALGLAAYLSVNPLSEMYVDALLGYNRIRFDSRRYVTANPSEGYAHGSRDADQLFASLTASYEYRQGGLSLAPYARVNTSYTRLDAYSERGGGIYGLSYDEQELRYVTSFLGVRSGYDFQTGVGVLTPRVGLAWGHNFERNEDYRMRYTDQGSDGLLYRLSPDPQDSNFIDLDLGLDLSLGRAWRVGFSYKTALGSDERSEMFRLGLEGRF